MSRQTVSKRCALCFTKFEQDSEDEPIMIDSLNLCCKCHGRFTQSAYNQRVMLINSVKCYRRLIAKYEDSGGTILDTSFENLINEENQKK